MEREISSGAMVGIVGLALASTVGLGFGVLTIGKEISSGEDINILSEIINVTCLAITSMVAWLSVWMAIRLTYLTNIYYDRRFKFTPNMGGDFDVKYLKDPRLSVFQVLHFLFKPIRYKYIDTFTIDDSVKLNLKGTLTVVDSKLFIDDYYLALNTDLFEYIGSEIDLNIQVAGFKQSIERNVNKFVVLGVTPSV